MLNADAAAIVRPAVSGKNQRKLLAELERLAVQPGCLGIWTEEELRKIGRDLDMGKQSARDAVQHGLRSLGYLVPTIGGIRSSATCQGRKAETGQKGRILPRQMGQKNQKGL